MTEDDAIEMFRRSFNITVEKLVRSKLDGWVGTITCGKYKLKVDIDLEIEE